MLFICWKLRHSLKLNHLWTLLAVCGSPVPWKHLFSFPSIWTKWPAVDRHRQELILAQVCPGWWMSLPFKSVGLQGIAHVAVLSWPSDRNLPKLLLSVGLDYCVVCFAVFLLGQIHRQLPWEELSPLGISAWGYPEAVLAVASSACNYRRQLRLMLH